MGDKLGDNVQHAGLFQSAHRDKQACKEDQRLPVHSLEQRERAPGSSQQTECRRNHPNTGHRKAGTIVGNEQRHRHGKN